MECPGCRHNNPPDSKFCGECGTRLQSLYPARQTADLPTTTFCRECGQRLVVSPSPVVEPAMAATAPSPASPSRLAAPESYTPKHLAEKILTSKSAMEGERKLVTVMFSDVSGFTAMSEKLDPEDVHSIMERVFEVIISAVHRYEGTINQFLGDGVMALFGAPIAHEDHPHRALSAALAIQQELQPIAADVQRLHGVEFRMRMGINTGLVWVGAIGKDLRMDYTAVGDTTNLAARFLGLAKPGQIVVSERTQRLLKGFFVFEDLGEFQVKGKNEPVRAYAVVSEIHGRTSMEVSRERGLTPLIGRDRELLALDGIHRRAAGGQGAIVLIAGEPGVGKSRLLYEFLQRLEGRGVLQLETSNVSYGRSMAYRPIIDLVRRYFRLNESVTGDHLRNRVSDQLEFLGLQGEEPVILLAHFLGVSAPPEFLDRLPGPQLKERTHELLREVFLRASDAAFLVLIVENMHWADAASEEFLAYLARGLVGHRVLLVLTTRPGYAAPWLTPPLAETITVESLTVGDVRGMVLTLLGATDLSEQLFKILTEKSEGNPLYVEEIIRQLQETSGIVVENGQAQLSRPDVKVPATIHDIIAARVDRLAEAQKYTLQGASVVGRRFGVSLLSRILEVSPDEVSGHLQELHGLDFVFPAAEEPELMYSFKHALTQDVVYAGVLERRRRQHHGAAGRGLEELYTGRVDDVVELIAYHFHRGQVWDRAVTYLRQASAKARGKWALREALASLEEALEALGHLPDSLETQQQGIDVRLDLRSSLYPLGEFEKMATYLRQAEAMATAISDSRRLGLVSIQIAEYLRQTGRFAEARMQAEQALALGEQLQDAPITLYAGHYLGLACHALGDYRRAAEVLRAVAQAPEAEWRTGAVSGMVIGSWAWFQSITLAWLARCLAETGEFGESIDAGRRAVTLAEDLGSPYSLTAAAMGLGTAFLVRGDLDSAGPVLERACTVAREANLTLLRPQAVRLLGSVYLLAGRIDEGLALVRSAAEEVESRRLLMQQAAVLGLLGEACLLAGKVEEGVTAAQRALTLAQDREQRGDAATALFVIGEAVARDPADVDKAERHYLAAIALTGELEMRPLLARSHLGIGRLYLRARNDHRAEEHLLTATRLFVSMDMPFWVQRTVVALSDLGRLLIVAPEHRDLYAYLSRVLASDGPIRVALDVPEEMNIDENRRQHVQEMLQLHGLSVFAE